VGCVPCRDGFYLFGKIISGIQNPPVLTTLGWVDLSNEVKTPLLKRSRNHYRFQRKIFELFFSSKLLTLDTRSNLFTNISENVGPEIPIFEDLISHGPPKMMSPT
jgi:hypothetical protein